MSRFLYADILLQPDATQCIQFLLNIFHSKRDSRFRAPHFKELAVLEYFKNKKR